MPVDSEPTLGVGSNPCSAVLLAATQPRFELELARRASAPAARGIPGAPMRRPALGGSGGASADAGSAAADGPRGVDVGFRGDVGPYDAAVIRSTDPNDPKPLIDWLNLNKYFVTPEGERLIDDYVREDKWFVAIRLLSETGHQRDPAAGHALSGPWPLRAAAADLDRLDP